MADPQGSLLHTSDVLEFYASGPRTMNQSVEWPMDAFQALQMHRAYSLVESSSP